MLLRIERRREIYFDTMLPPVPWIIRGDNAMLSLAAILVVSTVVYLLAS